MSFGDFAIDSFFNPINGINNLISPFFLHSINGPLELSINNPNKQESLFLQGLNRYFLNELITKTLILYGHSSGRL